MKSTCVFVLFTFLLVTSLDAQINGRVSGYIRDVFGKPVQGANVSLKNQSKVSFSEIDGFYRLEGIQGSTAEVVVSAVGFISRTHTLVLQADRESKLDIELHVRKGEIEEVQVLGQSSNQRKITEIKQSGFAVNVIDMNEHSGKVADLNQVLKRAPGVTIRENGGLGSSFAFKINGLDAKIFIDGIPMENFGSSMTLNNIPVNLVDRVEVYKGVVPAYLTTDVLGGAVNIITKRRNRQFFDFSYGYGSFNTHQASVIATTRDVKTGLMIKGDAFFNHSDNNYLMYSNPKYGVDLEGGMKIFTDEETGMIQRKLVKTERARRFYDAYTSGMAKVEGGFENVKWADRLFLGVTYAKNKNQLQLGSGINDVYGGRWSENNYIMPTLQYRKSSLFTPNLYVDAFASYSYSQTDLRDTARYTYYWQGTPYLPSDGPREESYSRVNNKSYIAKTDWVYHLNDSKTQIVSLNYNFSTNSQKSKDMLNEIDQQQVDLLKSVNKHIANLTWQGQWLDERLSSVLFLKYYGLDIVNTVDQRVFDDSGNYISGDIVRQTGYKDYPSYGLTLRYLLKKDAGIKASYEKAYRLPSISNIFGDGVDLLPNQSIKPEQSNNYNLGVFYNTFIYDVHFVNVDVTGFLRNADNYFMQQPVGNKFQYQNIKGAKLYGAEIDAKYGYKDFLRMSFNVSYDKAIVSNRYTDDTEQVESSIYKQQLPNRPWVYGNLDFSLGKNNLFAKGTRAEFTYTNQYTHWFYLSWANMGSVGTKNYVPTQYVHSAMLSYSWGHNKYGLTLEARNFTNELVYDNFRLQKPGRAFYTKLRMSIL
ncbi:TonB-dependent receptor [Sphingobacterium faecale]|uniref:TonB-dependent receptor n=1 Tax=Sphingobacterium faecale TaxID=2803775 RepID=A0ABS1R7R9_9SPHI|nr:TonB-dependent receptor [Sphingobacterium faecale]MBL1410761.1 TonB-dependent receptor [Sphingobacterium faecale]